MQQKDHHIAIIWSGAINYRNILDSDNIQIFQNIGVDDVQNVISSLDFQKVRAVIGAPGIAAEIRQLIPVPLVIAYPTYIDILETIKDAELNLSLKNRKIALILHETNKIQADRMDYFIQNTVDLYMYDSRARMRQIMRRISETGYDLVIGGPTAATMAKEFNINSMQLMYREQALLDALEKTREVLFLMDKELREYERLKVIIDVIPDGILETDAQGVIETCNRKALEMLHMSHDQVLGRNIVDFLGDPGWEAVYRDGASQADMIFTYRKSKYFSTRQPIMEGGRVIGSVGTLQRASKIQDMESKYRSQQTRGWVAFHAFDDIVAESSLMLEIVERAKIYTQCDMTVLLEGETGTGKEIFAQSIHNASERRRGPFVAINCAALTETLLESELMGYDEGAFTGARKGGKAGLFEQAHQGTIFLDEINHLPPPLQAKLLRVIQEKAVRHVGGDAVIPVDVRIIAATNENLKDKIAVRAFRSDLYYRINVLNILLPSLRERREDIPLLMRHFASRMEQDKEALSRRVQAMHILVAGYEWPGNIRELRNFVERYMILSGRVSQLDKHFFHEFRDGARKEAVPATAGQAGRGENELAVRLDTLENMESALIKAVVDRCAGNKSKAALLMDISRNTIHLRMKGSA
jgi:transcriptional regulator with PAS, ATPase and Fis domain